MFHHMTQPHSQETLWIVGGLQKMCILIITPFKTLSFLGEAARIEWVVGIPINIIPWNVIQTSNDL